MNPKTVLNGLKWSAAEAVLLFGTKFGTRILLLKVLSPNDFGLMGMCLIFISLAEVSNNMGFNMTLIQMKTDDEAVRMYPTAFTTSLIFHSVLALGFVFIVAPFAVWFYDETRLSSLIVALGLSLLLNPFSLIPNVMLTRALDFKSLATIKNASAIVASIVALVFALMDYGVWALIILILVQRLLSCFMYMIYSKWNLKLCMVATEFKQFINFSKFTISTGFISMLTYNLDNVIIGRLLGSNLLGQYTFSFSFTEQLRLMSSGVLNNVMFPVFSKVQKDTNLLKAYFLANVKINAILVYPIMVFLILFSRDVVLEFFGEKWKAAIIPMQILAFASIVHLLVNSFSSLFRAVGKPKLEMQIILTSSFCILLPGMILGCIYYGLIGVALAIVLYKFSLVAFGVIYLKKEFGITFKDIMKQVQFIIISVVFAGILSISLQNIGLLGSSLLLGAVFATGYVGLILFLERKDLQRIKNMVWNKAER